MSNNNSNTTKEGRRRISSANEALNSLRFSFAAGKLRPNQPIIESEIAKQLGMSRTPVREALRQLEMLGYLVRLQNRRLVVADATADDIRDMLETREALETMAVKLACQRASQKQLKLVEKYHDRCSSAIDDRRVDDFIKLNWAFHKETTTACGNKHLSLQIENNKEQFYLNRVPYSFTDADWRCTKKEHRDILDALLKRDEHKAVKAMQKHHRTAAGFAMRRI